MTVKKLAVQDLYTLTELYDYSNVQEMISECTHDMQNGIIDIFVLYDKSVLIGELHVMYQSDDENFAVRGRRAYLFAFRVHKDFQGKGYGQYLIKKVISMLKENGYREFTVGVEDDNLKAIHIYQSLGFHEMLLRKQEEYQSDKYEYNLYLMRETNLKAVCISASNMTTSKEQSTSVKISKMISAILLEKGIICEIIDLRKYANLPCTGCGGCYEAKRCAQDQAFNQIYDKTVQADFVFFVSPHYAPIPAKLSMILEKMEQITFLHWWKDNTYQSELYHIPAGIISHGGGADWALASYKAMVNDTIANALDTIQFRIVPFDEKWDTGISLPVADVKQEDCIFPIQEYDWESIEKKLQEYVPLVCRAM